MYAFKRVVKILRMITEVNMIGRNSNPRETTRMTSVQQFKKKICTNQRISMFNKIFIENILLLQLLFALFFSDKRALMISSKISKVYITEQEQWSTRNCAKITLLRQCK